MFRTALSALTRIKNLSSISVGCSPLTHGPLLKYNNSFFVRPFSSVLKSCMATKLFTLSPSAMLSPSPNLEVFASSIRSLTKFSLIKGKRKSCKPVIKRFLRLHWGGWIRTKSGRNKKMWKKTTANKRRLRQHVFVNGTQSWKLDSMVTKFWRRPRFYAATEDPYWNYNIREEFLATKRQPLK